MTDKQNTVTVHDNPPKPNMRLGPWFWQPAMLVNLVAALCLIIFPATTSSPTRRIDVTVAALIIVLLDFAVLFVSLAVAGLRIYGTFRKRRGDRT